MQTNSDGAPIKRKLSPESQQELLTLLGLGPDAPSESHARATLAGHATDE
jgi:hypothetical protein